MTDELFTKNVSEMTDRELFTLSEIFKSMGEPSRLKILDIILDKSLCVNEISTITGLSQSLVSHHLRTLRNTGVVKQKRSGRNVYYSLDDEHIKTIFLQGKSHSLHV